LEDYKGLIRLLTMMQSARFLNISVQTLYNRIAPKAKNPFPVQPIRIGKSVRFDIEDLKKFIESQKKSKDNADDTAE